MGWFSTFKGKTLYNISDISLSPRWSTKIHLNDKLAYATRYNHHFECDLWWFSWWMGMTLQVNGSHMNYVNGAIGAKEMLRSIRRNSAYNISHECNGSHITWPEGPLPWLGTSPEIPLCRIPIVNQHPYTFSIVVHMRGSHPKVYNQFPCLPRVPTSPGPEGHFHGHRHLRK